MNILKRILIITPLLLTLIPPVSVQAMAHSPKCPDGSDRIYSDDTSGFKSSNILAQFAVFNESIPQSVDEQYGYSDNYDCPMTVENFISGDRSMWKYYIAAVTTISVAAVAATVLVILKLRKR